MAPVSPQWGSRLVHACFGRMVGCGRVYTGRRHSATFKLTQLQLVQMYNVSKHAVAEMEDDVVKTVGKKKSAI